MSMGCCGAAFSTAPVRENEGFSWPWPHVKSEKKRIKELRREQESQDAKDKDEK